MVCSYIRPLQINSVSRPPPASSYCQFKNINISLFRILPLFSGYSCILTGSVKAISKQGQLTCQQCYQVGTNFTFVLFLQFKREGTSLSMHVLLSAAFYGYASHFQENNGLKSCQSYNEIMEMDRPPACKYA